MKGLRTGLFFPLVFLVMLPMFVFPQQVEELLNAVFQKDAGRVEDLLASGVDVNARHEGSGNTALMLACFINDVEMVELLLARGADANISGARGLTALHYGVGSFEIAKLLISYGADITARDAEGITPFIAAVFEILGGYESTDVLEILLSSGADINDAVTAGDAEGWTPLMFAVKEDHSYLATYLLKNGADASRAAKDGSTALGLAIENGNAELVRILKAHGAEYSEGGNNP